MAVLVNRAALAASLGDKPAPDAMDKQVKEIEQLVTPPRACARIAAIR